MPFSLHSDSPVTRIRPLRYVEQAVTRLTADGSILGADQRISVLDGLRAITITPAREHEVDADRGSLEPGKLADLVVLERDPRAVPPEQIADINVLATYLGGRRTYSR